MDHENKSLLSFFDTSSLCHGLVCNMIVAFPGHTHLFFFLAMRLTWFGSSAYEFSSEQHNMFSCRNAKIAKIPSFFC